MGAIKWGLSCIAAVLVVSGMVALWGALAVIVSAIAALLVLGLAVYGLAWLIRKTIFE